MIFIIIRRRLLTKTEWSKGLKMIGRGIDLLVVALLLAILIPAGISFDAASLSVGTAFCVRCRRSFKIKSMNPHRECTRHIECQDIQKGFALRSSAGDLNTAYEWLARQRGPPVSKYTSWVDPLEQTLPSPPSKSMGFRIDDDIDDFQNEATDNICQNDNHNDNKNQKEISTSPSSTYLRLPLYPVSSVHLPSSAIHTFNNVEQKNIKMALDLKAGRWHIPTFSTRTTTNDSQKFNKSLSSSSSSAGGYFVATLRAEDTHRIATTGTLMKVLSIKEEYSYNGKDLIRIVVQTQARGIVYIQGVEHDPTRHSSFKQHKQQRRNRIKEQQQQQTQQDTTSKDNQNYWIAHVKLLEAFPWKDDQPDSGTYTPNHKQNDHDDKVHNNNDNLDYDDKIHNNKGNNNNNSSKNYNSNNIHNNQSFPSIGPEMLQAVVNDYVQVRSLYLNNKNGVSSRELPPFAREAVQSNLPTFTKEDFLCTHEFWNIVECWQMLCNTVREARRSQLSAEMNEIMVKEASKKKGPLQLPIKRKHLSNHIQHKLHKMEQDACEDYISCGMDPCLDFQTLLAMGVNTDSSNPKQTLRLHATRINYLGSIIQREKNRLQTKEALKGLFLTQNDDINNSINSNTSPQNKNYNTTGKGDNHSSNEDGKGNQGYDSFQ